MPETQATLRPCAGRKVRDPDHGNDLLPVEGRLLVLTSYWRRRLADGDVERVAAPAKSAKRDA